MICIVILYQIIINKPDIPSQNNLLVKDIILLNDDIAGDWELFKYKIVKINKFVLKLIFNKQLSYL